MTRLQEHENTEISTLSDNKIKTADKVSDREPTRCSEDNDTFVFKKSENPTRQPTRNQDTQNAYIPAFFKCNKQPADKVHDKMITRCRQDDDKMPTTDKEDNNIRTKEDKNKYISQIVDYLNRKTGASYRWDSRSTAVHITERLNEGYTVTDFKTVIDKKCADWLNDKKMRAFLRPETLFGYKFEGYLNSAASVQDRSLPSSYTHNDDTNTFCERYGDLS